MYACVCIYTCICMYTCVFRVMGVVGRTSGWSGIYLNRVASRERRLLLSSSSFLPSFFFLRCSTLRWLSSCGIQHSLVATWRLSCPGACGILLPRPGVELVSPELGGEFLTTRWWAKSLLLPSSYRISLFLFVKLVNKSSTGSSRNVNSGHRFLPPVFVTFKIEHTSPLGVEAVWGINLVITIILLERKNSQILWGSKCYWCFWTVVLEKTLESPLDCKEIQPVHPKGDQSWVFVRRTDVEAETPILWLPDVKSWFIGKDPDAGKVWGKEEKGMTEDEMVGWHHRLDGHGFGWTPGVGDGQGGLECCDS